MSAKPKSVLLEAISEQLRNNDTGAITPQLLRVLMTDMVNGALQHDGAGAQLRIAENDAEAAGSGVEIGEIYCTASGHVRARMA